ncbi:hypothetical protein Tco_1192914 [Tanacetum coccineum]
MVPPNNLRPNLNGKAVNETHYRGMVGSLMYLTISKLDIQFSTCIYVRHQANPKESHLITVKRIFRYLKGKTLQGDDHEVLTNEAFSDPEETHEDREHEIAEIFRIETSIFDFETPLCTTFNEFNYLLKIDTVLFTHGIQGAKTYEEYENKLNNDPEESWLENGVPYELIDHLCEPFRFKNGKTKWPTCSSNEDGFCIGGELPGMVRADVSRTFNNHAERNDEEGIREERKPNDDHGIDNFDNNLVWDITPYRTSEEEEQYKEYRCEMLVNPHQEPSICKIRRFEMIKYSFRPAEKYIAIKECEYDDLTRTKEDVCHAYQGIFIMDKGWFVTRAE